MKAGLFEYWQFQNSEIQQYLSLFFSTISQKSAAAARMCKNIGNLVMCANSNCFSKYLVFHTKKDSLKALIYYENQQREREREKELKWHMQQELHYDWLHTSSESLLGRNEAGHSPIHTRQLQPPSIWKRIMKNETVISK